MRHSRCTNPVGAALVSAWLLAAGNASAQSTPFHSFSTLVPSDAEPLCPVSPATLATWFSAGVVAHDGIVTEADSVNFSDTPNCDFYTWSYRMFMWATSPAPSSYGSLTGTRTFASRIFYDVSPSVGGVRTLIAHPSINTNVLLPPQAFGEVLQAQSGSLVYYSRQVNDVLAWFRALDPNPILPDFPTTMADLSAIEAYAQTFDVTFPDANALAIELKASWVEASTLARPASYIRKTATIPTYSQTSSTLWTRTGTKRVVLAMTGMHVVGSAKGHPEMIWATFEHLDNAPNATFTYRNSQGEVTVPATSPTGPDWLFTASGLPVPAGTFNNQRMSYFADLDIKAIGTNTIGPSNVLRMKPWGAASNVAPNFVNTATSNTQIISINNSINATLQAQAAGDPRNNYFMTGSTWTIGGAAPTGPFPPPGNEVGTNRLANPTMETFDQGSDTTGSTGLNCFACHDGSFPGGSRVFDDLAQVPPPIPPPFDIPIGPGFGALAMLLLGASGVMRLRSRARARAQDRG